MLMRFHGVHVLDFPHFLTTAHTSADIEFIVAAVERTCVELRASGFMPERTYPIAVVNSVLPMAPALPAVIRADVPPVAGARLGRTPDGEAAWYVLDPSRPGKYVVHVPEAQAKGDGCQRWPGCCCAAGSRAHCASLESAARRPIDALPSVSPRFVRA